MDNNTNNNTNTEINKEVKKKTLNPRQEMFCKLYASSEEFFGNGLQSYAEAYGCNLNDSKEYATAKSNASRMLSNAVILERINEFLNLDGFNDAFADKQLKLLMTQNSETNVKLGAIKEYNNLKQRINQKLEITGDFNIGLISYSEKQQKSDDQ